MLARSHFEESSMKRKRKGKGKGVKENTLAFAFMETEYMYKVISPTSVVCIFLSFFQESVINFTYPVGGEDSGASEENFRTVILFPVEKLESILTALQHELV